ncbi:MAG: hypothetical protein PHQ61_08420 [Candidatus Omnitrophica bacterium]|nr:hypothetical protein [Candidatus Omnitrophota bacterium]
MKSTPQELKKVLNMKQLDWNREFEKTRKTTIDVLEYIQLITGFAYKPIKLVTVSDYQKAPTWCDGNVEIGYNNDPQALAHELGHGLHEKIREAGHEDKYGEEFADTIRYFVEKIISPTSAWMKTSKQNILLRECKCSFGEFTKKLMSKEFFGNIDWT